MTDSDSTRFFELSEELRHERDKNKNLNIVVDDLFIKKKANEVQMAKLRKVNENLLMQAGANGLMIESQKRTIRQMGEKLRDAEQRVSPWAKKG